MTDGRVGGAAGKTTPSSKEKLCCMQVSDVLSCLVGAGALQATELNWQVMRSIRQAVPAFSGSVNLSPVWTMLSITSIYCMVLHFSWCQYLSSYWISPKPFTADWQHVY
jgi:hypothetical protein